MFYKMPGSTDQRPVFVLGVGVTEFTRPGSKHWDYPDMGKQAGEQALADAGVAFSDVQAVVASYCYGEPTCGQRVTQELGLTGVPVFNVNNNCSSGSTALMLARTLVQAGMDCVMAIGFENMERGLSERYKEKVSPVGKHFDHLHALGADRENLEGLNTMTSGVIKMFAYAAREYQAKYPGVTLEDYARITEKNRAHGAGNPKAYHKKAVSVKHISDPRFLLCDPITVGMSTPTACGGAAAIVCSKDFLLRQRGKHRAVEILAQHMMTDLPSSFGQTYMDLVGCSLAKEAASRCYRDSGLQPSDVDVLEVHDCFSCNELFMYEALGLTAPGTAVQLFREGQWQANSSGGKLYKLGGRWVVNPSGGLEAKGHPIGATGLAQCNELVTQLRGEAGRRQVEGAKVALQHNFGLGSAAVVTIYGKPNVAKL